MRAPFRPLRSLTAAVLLALLALVCGWAPTAVPGPAAAATTPNDWAVFAGKGCACCHRVRSFGEAEAGPDLAHVRSGPGFFVIAAALWNHVAAMRVPMRELGGEWPQFLPQEMSNLISFVFTAQDRDGSGRAVEGASLFASRGCAQCHVAGARGQPLGPDSAEGDWRRGQRLLQDKGCLRCHSLHNKGGGLAPDLARSSVISST